MTEPFQYGRTASAPSCPCGAPSVWVSGLGRYCTECLPASAAFWLARARLAREATERFSAAIGRLA